VVDDFGRGVGTPYPPPRIHIGREGPLGRGRMLFALPLDPGPSEIRRRLVVHDSDLAYLADPDGNLIGFEGVRVSRMLTARWTEDTRRLG
jgi:hypothetical protein